jgi:hypothetical protein
MLKWKTRLVAPATMLLLLAASFGGGSLELIRSFYLDW